MPGENGVIFSAPTLMIHFVEAHAYLPPAPFLEAVMRPVPETWDAHAICEARRQRQVRESGVPS